MGKNTQKIQKQKLLVIKEVYQVKTFKINGLPFAVAKGMIYCLDVMCLDIETSNNHAEEPENLITWVSSIQVYFAGEYHLFRYPEDLITWLKSLYKKYRLYPSAKFNKKLLCYIHNASYDLSYLLPYLYQLPDCNNKKEGIIEGPNKILSFIRGSFEFRCSYRLSGKSLEKWSKDLNVEHQKQVGLYDYDKIIYQDSELTEDEDKYDKYDVFSMYECLQKQYSLYSDYTFSVPYTSTGYIRRTLRRSCRNDKYYRQKYFKANRLNSDLYTCCLKSYAGGITHNNRFYKNILIKVGKTYKYNENKTVKVNKIKHRDFKSHYPSQMTCNVFGLGVPQLIYDSVSMPFNLTIDHVLSWFPQYTSFCVIRMYEAKLKDFNISIPFMQYSKCDESHFDLTMLDNGRILKASGCWIMNLDNLTLAILNEQYNLDYEILQVYRMKNEKLPKCVTDVVDYYFKGKTDKKAKVHELENLYGKTDPKTFEAMIDLQCLKAGLNGLYGCFAMNPLQTKTTVNEAMEFKVVCAYKTKEEIEEGLDDFYKGKNNFLNFATGCLVTAWARFELYQFIKAIGYEKVLYVDTDSCFYIADEETEKAIEELNKEKRKTAHYVELDSGEKEYYDEFTEEPECLAFKGLHSKCYGVVTDKGLEVTIAGVPARTLIGFDEDHKPIYYTREQELAGNEKDPYKALNKLKDGFEFKINAGVSALYVGATGYRTPRVPTILNIDGHEIHTAGGCVIRKLKSKKVKDVDLNKKYDPSSIEFFEMETIQ